jgi:mRNA interferase HigB
VTVVGADRLVQFGSEHADAAAALAAWRQTVAAATWRNPADVRRTYGSADPVVPVASGRRVAVFNIRGNRYRLVAAVDYQLGICNVLRVMTHEEYGRNRWKDVL